MRTVHETSAGGLVVDGLEELRPRLIGRLDRRGRLLWSLPKGHIEDGETAEQTAVREVDEETGIRGRAGPARQHRLLVRRRGPSRAQDRAPLPARGLGGELSDEDVEVTEVAWVPLGELRSRLAYADERRLAEVADELIQTLHTKGPGALPPLPHSTPWRRRQTHSTTRRRPHGESGSGRANGHGRP